MSAYVYRRGSIFWALTLITVGILFLYQNFNPAIHPWEILAKFWPVVIIFWGLSKLIDHLQARAHPESTPPPLFSASEVILLILVLITGTVVSKIVLHQWSWIESGINSDNDDWDGLFSNSYTYTGSVSAAAGEPQPHVVLVDHHGDVEVRSSSQPTLQASIKETIHANSDQEAKKLSDQLKFEFAHQGGQYTLQSNIDSLPDAGRNVRLDVVLSVPSGATTDLTVEHGDLTASGLKGGQTFTVDHGDAHISQVEGLVKLQKSGGSTQVSNVKGSVELQGRGDDVQISDVTGTATVNGEFGGDVEFSNVTQTVHYLSQRTDLTTQELAGRLTMDSGSLEANGVRGPFEITTKAKDITLDGFAHSVKITNTDGDIQLRAAGVPTHSIDVQSGKGEIQLNIPPKSAFQIDAESKHGEVDSEFTGPDLKINNNGDQPSITGSYGKGGPVIHLSTAYGTIHLGQGEASMPPTPPEPPAAPTPSSRT